MGRGEVGHCQYFRCTRFIDPHDRLGSYFGLCPRHARDAEKKLKLNRQEFNARSTHHGTAKHHD